MKELILSTSNIIGSGSAVSRRPLAEKSNTEFTSSLRANFQAAEQELPHKTNGHANGNGTAAQFKSWTEQKGDAIFVPALDFTKSGLSEERSQYEITVKLFFLPRSSASCRCNQTREAVKLVLDELHMPSIDLLIVSYPSVTFDAEDEDEEEGSAGDEINGVNSVDNRTEDIDTMIKTWGCLEELHDEGVIEKLGVSEFGSERLRGFIKRARIRPSVDQINVKDCCVVPKPLIKYAKQEKVELLTHNDCTNILPSGTVRELLGSSSKGAGVLADNDEATVGLKGDVEPQWVIKYTAVVKDRGVIENKGYFALAELQER